MISLNGIQIVPTIFPDQTSQVWKIDQALLDQVYKDYIATITWDFHHEAELIHVAQLRTLLSTYTPIVHLEIPYLPYGRQDKRISNDSTFALATFATLINSLDFAIVRTIDAHNNPRAHAINNLVDLSPRDYIEHALKETGANLVLYPDAGARTRYEHLIQAKSVHAEKMRNQATGQILFIDIKGSVRGKSVLIVDDLIDAGGTFVLVAQKAKKAGARFVHLYATHALLTAGVMVLKDGGIDRIFSRKGELVETSHACWDYKGGVK